MRLQRWLRLLAAMTLGACGSEPLDPAACGAIAAAIGPATPSVALGHPEALTVGDPASGEPLRYCSRPLSPSELQWSSANPSIATVDASTGVVSGVSAGTTTIAVRWTRSDAPLASVELVVYAPLNGRIIFSRQTAADVALWTMTAGGADARLLLGGLDYPERANVSPDGRSVVFENWSDIYTVDGAGRNKRKILTGLANNSNPSWSRDGAWILFNADDATTGAPQVFMMRRDGSDLHRVTTGFDAAFDPAWSPAGNEIAFLTFRDSYYDAVAMDTSGANARILTAALPVFSGYGPSWSPDGQSILFLGGTVTGCPDWCIMKLGVNSGVLDVLGDAEGNMPPRWSPDGGRIVFGSGDIWVMSADGSSRQSILADGEVNWQASWAP